MQNSKMIKKYVLLLFLIIILLIIGIGIRRGANPPKVGQAPRLIAHGGGDVYGVPMTNSLEALNSSYQEGFRWIEIDFGYTTDLVPICIHDWGNANWFMNIEKSTLPMSMEEFKKADSILDLQLLTVGSLEGWVKKHPLVSIITDIKENNIEFLSMLKESYPKLQKQVIPQIYSFEEYDEAVKLGYKDIILTLYQINSSNQEIINFCKENKVLAVTMDETNGLGELPKMLADINVLSYVHTINGFSTYKNLRRNGAYGVYTDYFQPDHWIEE